jgi:hypothetical protein
MARRFTRTIEDFTCGHCGAKVSGTGYTNHCPRCLYSRHVDIAPGDRAATCGALMRPLRAHLDHGRFVLTHECSGCGALKRNKAAPNDDRELLLRLAAAPDDLPY